MVPTAPEEAATVDGGCEAEYAAIGGDTGVVRDEVVLRVSVVMRGRRAGDCRPGHLHCGLGDVAEAAALGDVNSAL